MAISATAALISIVMPVPARADGGGTGSVSGSQGGGSVTVHASGGGGIDHQRGGGNPNVRSINCGGVGQTVVGDTTGDCGSSQVACAFYEDDPDKPRVAVVTQRRDAAGRWQFAGTDCVTDGPPQVTAEMVREQAVRLVPAATVGLAPHGTSLVNIETVIWADAPKAQTLPTVTILGRSVAIRLTLDHVAWDFGDGESDGDAPAGKPYDKTGDPCRSKQCADYFGHTYRRTGSVRVGATASWTASFTVDGGAAVDIPGTVDGPRSDAPLVVKQARAVLVPNPGEH